MKFQPNERGFVLAEFAIALPLLILLLYSLGMVTVAGLKIAREQVADYALETEAQYVIDRITSDARTARYVEVRRVAKDIEEIFFIYHGNKVKSKDPRFYDFIEQRRYTVSSPNGRYCVYAERMKNGPTVNPISGDNFFGQTFVRELKFTETSKNVLHIKFKLQSIATKQAVEFNTSVYMPSCEEFRKVSSG